MENRFYDLQFLEDFLALHVREFRLKIARKGERERYIFLDILGRKILHRGME